MSLDPNNLNYKDEYENVSRLFNKTAANKKIEQIERIQNPSLFKQYVIKKQSLDEKNGSNEMFLFHGTKGDKLAEINETGLNRNYAGINGKDEKSLNEWFTNLLLLCIPIHLSMTLHFLHTFVGQRNSES